MPIAHRRLIVASACSAVLCAIAMAGGRVERLTAASAAPADLDVRVTVGSPEVVMDYSSMTCRRGGGMDLPDVQAHAMRRPDGSLLLVSGNAPLNMSMSGADFDHLTRDCSPVLESGDSPDAHSFDNQEWLLAVFREGATVHGLVHNEYHDPVAANCRPGITDPSNPCWYNAVTYARSDDGGHTFTQSAAPAHVAAALPYPWDASYSARGVPPPHGYFTPSNIVRGPDGAFYTMFMAIVDRATSAQGQCVMRTVDLADPSSWRAWDGTGYNLPMPSPYDTAGRPAPTGRAACAPVSPGVIGGMGGSLTYNTFFERYLLVGSGVFAHGGGQTCGTWLSLSEDLIDWSAPRLIMPGKLPYPPCGGGSPDGSLIYPSLIDHADTDVNFQYTGATPHLYYVRWNQGLDRDLLRVPLTFRLAGPGEATETPLPSATPGRATGTPARRTATPTVERQTPATPALRTATPTAGSQTPATPARRTATPTVESQTPATPALRTATPTAGRPPEGTPSPTATATVDVLRRPALFLPLLIKGVGASSPPTPGESPMPLGTPAPSGSPNPSASPTPGDSPTPGASPTPGDPPTPSTPGRAAFEPPDGRIYHGTSPNPTDVDAYIAALGNARLQDNPVVLARWRERLDGPAFVHRAP